MHISQSIFLPCTKIGESVFIENHLLLFIELVFNSGQPPYTEQGFIHGEGAENTLHQIVFYMFGAPNVHKCFMLPLSLLLVPSFLSFKGQGDAL